tara:strand:+ start:629 stop:814 length:186 start_codon:yes stop_codon:yes gene_type:complete
MPTATENHVGWRHLAGNMQLLELEDASLGVQLRQEDALPTQRQLGHGKEAAEAQVGDEARG